MLTENILGFLAGFMFSGLIGWGATVVLKHWLTLDISRKWPIQIYVEEYFQKIISLALMAGSLVLVIAAFFFGLWYSWVLAFLSGFFFSMLLGVHLRTILSTWKGLGNDLKRLRYDKNRVSWGMDANSTEKDKRAREIKKPEQDEKVQVPLNASSNTFNLEKVRRRRDLEELISEKKRRLHKLKIKSARLGMNTPPEDLLEIEDIEKEIEELQAELIELEEEDK